MPPIVDEYEQFVRARTPALLRCAYLLTGDQHLAEDLVQAALARTHRAWRGLHQSGNAEAYTRKVMYHLQVSWWRRRRVPERLVSLVPEQRAGVDLADRAVVRATLRQALARLTANQRAVLVARFFEDRSEADTAEALGVSVGTVKSQAHAAIARLRALMPDLEPTLSGGDEP